MAIRVAFIKNTDITDAHGWVFSRIIYSCSAAYCLVFDAPPARRMSTDLSHAESCMHGRMPHVGACLICVQTSTPRRGQKSIAQGVASLTLG